MYGHRPVHRVRTLRTAFASLLAVALLGALAPLASISAADSRPTAPHLGGPTTYVLDDFDDPWYDSATNTLLPPPVNMFFGRQGIWNNDAATITRGVICSGEFDCYLSLGYSLLTGGQGGYVEEVNYSYDPDTFPLRDLREFARFRFRVRGDATTGYADHFLLEFIGPTWNDRKRFPVVGVTEEWQWRTIDLAPAADWDWSQIRQIAVVLDSSQLPGCCGRFFFDDFEFISSQAPGDALDATEYSAWRYFWENRHPITGLVRDRASDPVCGRNWSSVAAVGYELAAFGIGANRGWITRSQAADATLQVLHTLADAPQGPATGDTSGYQGFFYHFLDISTGLRADNSEVSTIDSALLLSGILFVRQYYTGADAVETEIRSLADLIYRRVNWPWAVRDDAMPVDRTRQFYMAWKPERHDCAASEGRDCYEIPAPDGFGYFSGHYDAQSPQNTTPTTWNWYTDEVLLINVLALASPEHAVGADTFWRWLRQQGTYDGYTFYYTPDGSLFTYEIGQNWLDLRCQAEIQGGAHVNWWQNSRLAILADRQYCVDHGSQHRAYSTLSWGLSASLGPPSTQAASECDGLGTYRVYGAPPAPYAFDDGTVAPYSVAAALPFLSFDLTHNEAYLALAHWYQDEPELWGLYGFRDGLNLDSAAGWYAHDYLGLDQGMALVAIENRRSGLIWRMLRQDPGINAAQSAVLAPTCSSYLPLIWRP